MAQDPSALPNNAVESTAPGSLPPAIRIIPTVDPESDLSDETPHPGGSSRIAEQSAIAHADGLSTERREASSSAFYDVDDEDFVAVDHEDLEDYSWSFHPQPRQGPSRLDQLHPFVQLLSLANVDDCVKVEEAFPENERCTGEKIVYRLTKCPELSLGIFSLPPQVANQPKPRPTLVAHILATRTTAPTVTEATMGIPPDWRQKGTIPNGTDCEPVGHQDQGSTIVIHSLAVLHEHQGKGLGTTLIKAYIQRIKDAEIADRIALLAHEPLVQFYQSLGFANLGQSDCKFGSGGWYNMVLTFTH